MAVYIKENNSDSLQLSTSWVGGVAPGQLNTGKFDATLSAVSSITLTGRWMVGSFWYSNSCPVNSFSVSGNNVESYNNTGSTPNGRSILIEAGRTFTTAGNLIFLNSADHAVEVAAGSELIPDGRVFAALSGSGTSSVTKYGSGTMWFGRATSTPGVGAITGLTIAEGTIKVAGLGGTGTNPIGTGNITFNGSGTPTLQFNSHNSAARTLPNAVVMTTAGTIDTPAGFTATMSGAASGAGALTISGGGTLNWSNTVACPVNIAPGATLNMGSSAINGAMTGTGTVAMSGGTIGGNSPAFAGTITGNFNFSGGVNTLAASSITGTVTPTGGILTLAGSGSGILGDLGFVILYLTGNLSGGAGGTTNLIGPGGSAYLGIDGASAGLSASRTVAMRNNSVLALFNGASFAGPLTSTVDTTTSTLVAASASSCTLSGNFSTNQASGLVVVEAAVGGTLTLGGALTSSNAGRAFALNENATHSPPGRASVNIGGTIKLTGSGFSGSPATLKRGTLYLNSTSSVGVGTTLTVSGSGTTVACSSTGPYAAQITGNMSFGAGTVLRFGAPA